jgi:hypothetical protein
MSLKGKHGCRLLCIEIRDTDSVEKVDLVGVLAAVSAVADGYQLRFFQLFERLREDGCRDLASSQSSRSAIVTEWCSSSSASSARVRKGLKWPGFSRRDQWLSRFSIDCVADRSASDNEYYVNLQTCQPQNPHPTPKQKNGSVPAEKDRA